MNYEEKKYLSSLSKMSKKDRYKFYKIMGGITVRRYDFPVRFAIRIGLGMLILLLIMPIEPISLYLALIGSLCVNVILG